MASILTEILLDASPAEVWDAVRDVGAVHRRLAPGFVSEVTDNMLWSAGGAVNAE